MGGDHNEACRLPEVVHWLFPDSYMAWACHSRAWQSSPREETRRSGVAAVEPVGRMVVRKLGSQARFEEHLISHRVLQLSSAVAGRGSNACSTRNPLQLSSAVAGQRSSTVIRSSGVHGRVAALATSAVAEHMRPQSRSAFARSRGASARDCVTCT